MLERQNYNKGICRKMIIGYVKCFFLFKRVLASSITQYKYIFMVVWYYGCYLEVWLLNWLAFADSTPPASFLPVC